jgi:pimeloyl-ACP methyl ester carboxylesterase
MFRPDADVAARVHGLRLLSYDRPGYGGRPRQEGRAMSAGVHDVQRIAEALGINRLAVWGFSGGGSYALACAAMLPDLVTGAAVFATFAPYGSAGLDFCEGMSPAYAHEVELFFTDRPLARANWRRDAEEFGPQLSTAAGWMERWGERAGADDAHSQEVAEHLAAIWCDAMTDGDDGWWDDWSAVLSPWGCDLTRIAIPVRLWHGVHDTAVPVAQGRWLAAHVPGLIAHFGADEDHTNVESNNREAAYAWLRGLR